MHCHDYQAEPMRSCCATTIGEEHGPDCNRARERRMVAAADERIRVGKHLHSAGVRFDWQPAPRTVRDITMWDAPHDASATIPVPHSAEPDATGDPCAEELEGEPDPELERFVSRLRAIAWLILLLPLTSCAAFRAGERLADVLALAPSPAAAWGQVCTVVLAAAGLAAIASSVVGADEPR